MSSEVKRTHERLLALTPVHVEPGHSARYVSIGPMACGQTWFQYAVIAVPAETVPVSWRAPDVPSSLQAIVGSVALVIGLLKEEGFEWGC